MAPISVIFETREDIFVVVIFTYIVFCFYISGVDMFIAVGELGNGAKRFDECA